MTRPSFPIPLKSSETTAARTQMWVALLLTALSVAVHGRFMLQHGALWRDEVNSVGLATMPSLRELWASLSYDSSPVLWPLLLRVWIFCGAGDSDASIRFFGFLTQISILGGLWFSSLSITRRAPIVSLLLLGYAPAIVLWPSLRSYGLGTALILWTFGCLWRALENPSPRRVGITFVMALLSVQCVYANLLLLGAICSGGMAVCFCRQQRKLALFPFSVLMTAAVSLLIYIPTFMRIAPWQKITLEKISFETIIIRSMVFVPSVWIGLLIFLLFAIPFLFKMALKVSRPTGKETEILVYSFIVLVLGFFATTLFLEKAGRLVYSWHFVGMMCLISLCIDPTYHVITKNPKTRNYVSLTILALSLPLFFSIQGVVTEKRTNLDLIARYLDKQANPEDLVIVNPFYLGVTYRRYSSGKTLWIAVPDIKNYEIQRYDTVRKLMGTSDSLQSVQERISKTLRSGHRIWFVGSLPEVPAEPPLYILPEAYGSNGWFYARYMTYCSAQISYFLSQQGTRRSAVPILQNGPVSPLEDVGVEMIEGLKPPSANKLIQ